MISCNQKALSLLLLALTFSFSADAAQMKHQLQDQDKKDLDADDDPNASSGTSDSDDQDGEDDKDDADEKALTSSAGLTSHPGEPTYPVKAPKIQRGLEKDDEETDTKEDDASKDDAKAQIDVKRIEQDLTTNLNKQAALKRTIEHFSNETQSDQEIDAAGDLVANETESEATGDMLADMWKDMRMFEVPSYTKHAKEGLRNLKRDEAALEAKLTAAEGKVSAAHDGAANKTKDDAEDEDEEKQEDEQKAGQKAVDKEPPTSTWNVWKMNHKGQRSVFVSSLVYIAGGILAAVLFKQVRARHFVPEVRRDVFPTTKDFSFHIFGCFGDLKLCALGFCCPCLTWANTLDRTGLWTYWKAFGASFGLLLLHIYTMGVSSLFVVALGVYYRQKLRDSYEIDNGSKGTVAMDILVWCFCQPCAIIQEAREEGVTRKSDQV